MTDPYAAPTYEPTLEDVVEDTDNRAASLDRRADELLAQAEGRSFATDAAHVSSVRQAVREDLSHGRDWARARVARSREAIQDEPLKIAAYAVGLGVLIGLLLRR